jgi:hypothetical protein
VAEEDHLLPEGEASCGCFTAPHDFLITDTELGLDEHFGTASLLRCSLCGQRWLRYFYEIEAFTASGRRYLGPITVEQASRVSAENAKTTLEGLSWYFFGGSFYGGKSGRTSGNILLFP